MTDIEFARRVQEVVCAEAGLKKVSFLIKRNQELRVARFRDSAIYVVRENTDLSVEQIGELFGARHHTTVVCAIRREKIRLQRHPIRHDGRTWPEWHAYLRDKAREGERFSESAKRAPEPPPRVADTSLTMAAAEANNPPEDSDA